jgi:hypothetical protein
MTSLIITLALLACLCISGVCAGQQLVVCETDQPDSVTCPSLSQAALLGKGRRQLSSGQVLYEGHLLISRICALGNGVVVIGFGNQQSNGEAFTVTCSTSATNSLFNRYEQGLREGPWLQRNLGGRITQVVDYHAGAVRSVLRFWANGLPRQRVFYAPGNSRVARIKRYAKQGYLQTGMMPF